MQNTHLKILFKNMFSYKNNYFRGLKLKFFKQGLQNDIVHWAHKTLNKKIIFT